MSEKLTSYQPRHVRLGLPLIKIEPIICYHEIKEDFPVIDDKGKSTIISSTVAVVKASEDNEKYTYDDFRLEALLDRGVKLDAINVQRSQMRTIDEIDRIVDKLGSLEAYSAKVAEMNREFDAIVNPPVESSKSE